MMKRVLSLLLATAIAAFVISCTGDKFSAGKIDMELQFETLDIDLNIADNPYVLCVINSETDLASVTMYIVRKDGSEEQYKEPVVSFRKPNMHTVHERPVYDEDMSGFKIVAKDKGGAVESRTVSFEITPVVTPPVTTFSAEGLAFAEGDSIPSFSFSVAANAALLRISVELVESGTFLELVPDIVAFESPLSFTFNSADFALAEYNLDKIPQAIRVTAEDSYGKISISVLPISYKALPRPELTVSDIPDATEFTGFSVSGSASSETGISDVSVYAVGKDYEFKVGSQFFQDEQSCNFTIAIDGNEIRDFLTGIKVVAMDARTKKTEVTVPITVNPVFWQVSATDNLATILESQFADPKFRRVKLALAPDASYDLGNTVITMTKILLMESPAGHPATVKTNAAQPWITNAGVVDTIRFTNIHFNTSKSGAGFLSFTNASTVGAVSIDGCLFDGAWSGPFVRFQNSGTCSLGSFDVDDCIIKWANKSGGYSFFHFATNGDKVGRVSLTNSTVAGPFYLSYCNLSGNNTGNTIEVNITNNTFVNLFGSANGYHVSVAQSSLKGTITFKNNLYGGSNNITGAYKMLRANTVSTVCENNWCTPDWKTFTDDSANGAFNFLTVLPDTENNAGVFEDLENFNLTVKAGTSVRTKGIGDPRWLK